VLTGRVPWYEKPTRLLKKRAVLADTTAELIDNVNNYLHNGHYPADTTDKEFLKNYGSDFTAHEARSNVLKALNEIL